MGKQITIDEMKKIELEMMKIVDKVCRENDINYSLIDGSLLGAVRHQGFIPWDDDMDIMMPRPDYEKFKKVMLNNNYDGIKYMDFETQDDCHYGFAKVYNPNTILEERDIYKVKNFGVYIDIFPLDGLPDDPKQILKHMKKVAKLRNIRRYAIHTKLSKMNKVISFLYKICSIPIKIYGYKRINKKANKLMKKYDYNTSNYVTILYSDVSAFRHKYFEKSFFDKTHYSKFEDTEFKILDNYDKYLKDMYGNYMEFPPEDKRESGHFFDKLEWR